MRNGRPRIGVTQRADDVAGRDERRDALDQQWTVLLDREGFWPVPIPNRLSDPAAFLADLEIDAIVLSGGNDMGTAPERDATEASLLDAATHRDLPVLGVCRGLQLMVTHAGGTLHRVDGHVARTHSIAVVEPNDWPVRDGRVVNSFHNWGVAPDALGSELVALALASDGTVEALARRGHRQVAVMWHPERDAAPDDDVRLLRALIEAR